MSRRRRVARSMSVRISGSVRGRYPELAAELNDFDQLTDEHDRRFRDRFTPEDADDEQALTPGEKAEFVMVSALARARLLVWTVAHCVNGDLAVGAFLA